MSRHRLRAAKLAAAMLLAAGLGACSSGQTVTIKYTPLANMDWTGTSPSQTAKTGILSVYCIVSIENKEPNAVPFQFDPARLSVQPPNSFVQNAFWQLFPLTVAPGASVANPGTLSVLIPGADTPSEAWVPLYYTTIGSESVIIIQVPAQPQPLYSPTLPQPFPQCPPPSAFG